MKRATEEAKEFSAASCQLSDEGHAWRLRWFSLRVLILLSLRNIIACDEPTAEGYSL